MRAHSTFGQCRAPCSPEVAERFYVICSRRVFDRSASVGHGALHCPSVVASTAFPSPPRVSLFPPVWWRRWGAGGRFWAGANPIVTSQYLPPSHSHAATTRRPPLPPSRRAWGCGFGRRVWRYGNAVLATTDGQHRGQCPTDAERSENNRSHTTPAALKAGEHCPLCCPNVE